MIYLNVEVCMLCQGKHMLISEYQTIRCRPGISLRPQMFRDAARLGQRHVAGPVLVVVCPQHDSEPKPIHIVC